MAKKKHYLQCDDCNIKNRTVTFYSQYNKWLCRKCKTTQGIDWYDLKNLSTRLLMKYREKAYACGSGYDPTENCGRIIPIEKILAELNTREHIPNKIEARKIRQEKAKVKR